MIKHSVYFWLNPTAPNDIRNDMPQALRGLAAIPQVLNVRVGPPAIVPLRPVLENSYDFALILETPDANSLLEYQAHPIHDVFLAKFSAHWARVLVLDVEISDV